MFFVKRWDNASTHRFGDIDNEYCSDDYQQISESVKTIGETQAYHNLLLLAYEKNNIDLLKIILDEMKDDHLSLLKIHRYFQMNFTKGNYEICKYLFEYYGNKVLDKIGKFVGFEVNDFPHFLNMMDLYLKCYSTYYDSTLYKEFPHNNFKKFILNIEKYILSLDDENHIVDEDIYNKKYIVNKLGENLLNRGLFIECDTGGFQIFTFDFLIERTLSVDFNEKLTEDTIIKYIQKTCFEERESSNFSIEKKDHIQQLVKANNPFKKESNLEKLEELFVNLIRFGNCFDVIIILFREWLEDQSIFDKQSIKIIKEMPGYASFQKGIDMLLYFVENISSCRLIDIIFSVSRDTWDDNLLKVITSIEYRVQSKKCIIYDQLSIKKLFDNLGGKSNFKTIIKVFELLNINNLENVFRIDIIENILKTNGNQVDCGDFLDYFLDTKKFKLDNTTFNNILGYYYTERCWYNHKNHIYGLLHLLKKYKNNKEYTIVLGKQYTKGESYSGRKQYGGTSYSYGGSTHYINGDDLPLIIYNLLEYKNIEVIDLFLMKCTDDILCKIDNQLVKNILSIGLPSIDLLTKIILKSTITSDYIAKCILNNENISQEHINLLSNIINIEDYTIDILRACCSSDNFLEYHKKFLNDHNPSSLTKEHVSTLFTIACEKNAHFTVEYLYNRYESLHNLNTDELFVNCCKLNNISVCSFLKKNNPKYTLIVKNDKIVYYDIE